MPLFFGRKKVEAVIFSPLEGHLTFEGRPAAGAKIKLWYAWKDTKGETFHYIADNNGFFKIPKHTSMYKPFFLAQLVISQELTVEYEGIPHQVWLMSKKDPAEFTELGVNPTNLICELSNELAIIRSIESLGGTKCTWDQRASDEALDQ